MLVGQAVEADQEAVTSAAREVSQREAGLLGGPDSIAREFARSASWRRSPSQLKSPRQSMK